MKRIGKILSLSILIVLLASTFSFAKGLTLENIYPEEGEKRLQPNNVAVKLTFSENVTSKEAQISNEDCFKITDPKGKEIKYNTLYNDKKYPEEIWLQIKETLEPDTRYTLTISEELISSAGNTLESPIVSHYSIRDTKQDSKGYMFLMFFMIAGMMVYTVIDAKRKAKKEMQGSDGEVKVNPYKEARRTGKSVEEIVAKTEKKKKRLEKKRGKEGDDEDIEEVREGVKRVQKKRPISAVGAATPKRVIEMREAREKAEAMAKEEEEAKKKAMKKKASKNKGSRKQRKKK